MLSKSAMALPFSNAVRTYAQRVKELLQEYQSLSRGKIEFQVVDPAPFSEEEDAASAAGLQGVPAGLRGDEIYFGLVGESVAGGESSEAAAASGDPLNLAKNEEVIPFFQLDKEKFLEYDLTKLIFNLSQTEPPTLGIISGIPINGGFDYATRQNQPAWVVVQQMEDLFQLEWLSEDVTAIDDNIDILMLVHPNGLSDETLLAIDQFVLKGGRTLVFMDGLAETAQAGAPMMPAEASASDLGPLLQNWGLELVEGKVLGDYANSLVVSMRGNRSPVRHIGLVSLTPDSFASEDVLLAGLESINMSSVGILQPVESATTTVTPLIRSSDESNLLDASLFTTLTSPETLLNDFSPSGERYILAARVSGKATTAFPDGIKVEEDAPDSENADAPVSDDVSETESSDEKPKITRTVSPDVTSADNINLIVIADTDILTDRLWVQVQEFFGQRIASPWADNAALLVNSLDNLSGNADLISVRSRGRFSRPFDRVDELRRQAEEKLLEQQKALQEQLAETDSRLAELEQVRGEDDKAILSEEQEQTVLKFQEERLKIRKQLRDVQHQLDQDIETLGRNLKLINIFLVPLLLTVLALFARVWMRNRRLSVQH
ncbi:MAG: Gldg family protein [Pseudomonadales bacterium]|nr:Gldg family protein [Pseudomonadales bacterium]